MRFTEFVIEADDLVKKRNIPPLDIKSRDAVSVDDRYKSDTGHG